MLDVSKLCCTACSAVSAEITPPGQSLHCMQGTLCFANTRYGTDTLKQLLHHN